MTVDHPSHDTSATAVLRDPSLWLAIVLLVALYIQPGQWLFAHWMANFDNSVGIMAPVFSAWVIWMRCTMLCALPTGHDRRGLVLAGVGLLVHLLGLVSGEYLLSGLALPMLLHGGALWLVGRQRAAQLAFPFWFLLFAWPFFDALEIYLSFPMRLVSTVLAEGMLTPFMEVTRNGTELITPNINVAVIASCSGLNYLSTLLMLGVLYAWLTEDRVPGRVVLLLFTPVVVLVANGLRIAAVAVLGYFWGRDVALGFFHDFSGLLVFALAVLLFFLISLGIHHWMPSPVGEDTMARPRSEDDLPDSERP
ncbi:MAG: exosortase/archaeosortase family protein [Gammaproteobacteria bacterium]